jgi:hypothetical protein
MRLLYSCVLLLLLRAAFCFSKPADLCSSLTPAPHVSQYDALMQLYNATNGHRWSVNTNWGSGSISPCHWFGIRCNPAGNVTVINLCMNHLSGYIPSSIASLSSLREIALTYNNLFGDIPFSLGSLSELAALDLSRNQLSGEIPASLGCLSHLSYLLLPQNRLVGSIPAEIGSLTELTTLDLSLNHLSGLIPPTFQNLYNLTGLFLSNNRLSGTIPVMSQLEYLIYFWLGSNYLTGPIPSWLGSFLRLNSVNMSYNSFTGCVPSFSESNLQYLFLNDNNLTCIEMTTEELVFCNLENNSFPCPVPFWVSGTCGARCVSD